MKIGILTLPLHTNYGGILQAYALQKVLKDMGHDVWLINKEKTFKLPLNKIPLAYIKRIIKKVILNRTDTIIFLEKKRKHEYAITSVNTKKFITDNIQPRLTIKKESNIPRNYFDAIVVGSDQIWRLAYNKPNIENAFLGFAKKWKPIKRIAYAPSFGTSKWEYNDKQTRNCKRLIQQFDAVSIREDSGVNLCKRYFNVDAQLVLDPTMLLDVTEYIDLANSNTKDIEEGLFVYILDQNKEKQKVVNAISKKIKCNPLYASTDNQNINIEKRITTPVEEWLKSFYKAKFVVTDSFHACVFSILFNKPFIAYGNVSRGLSRFQSLLKLFKLEERFITSFNELTDQKIVEPINWKDVNQILTNNKNRSLQFLKTHLES